MKLSILIFFVTLNVSAEAYKISGDLIEFKNKDELLLNGCETECDALTTIKKHKVIDLKKARRGMKYTNSTGSDVCSRVYKAKSLLGIAQNKDQRAFCYFKDKSMVEMNSLTNYLEKHKIIKN